MNRLINQLRFRQLHLACVIADTGSIRAAADQMRLSAPAVSKSLRELEGLVGQSLFTRSVQGMIPTPAGVAFVRSARTVIGEMRVFGGGTDLDDAAQSPPFRIGAITYVIWALMPQVLETMRERGENVRLVGVQGGLGSMTEQLAAGEIDVLLTLNAAEAMADFDRSVVNIENLHDDQMLIVASAGLVPDAGAAQRWSDLLHYPWILPPRRTHVRNMVDTAFFQAGLQPPDAYVDAAQLYGCLRLTAQGLGLTVIPRLALMASGLADRVEIVNVVPPMPALSTMLVYRRSSMGRRTLRVLVEAVRAATAAGG